jgi:hypothetical protein
MILAQQVERIEIQTHSQLAHLNRFSVNDIFVVVSTTMDAQVLIKVYTVTDCIEHGAHLHLEIPALRQQLATANQTSRSDFCLPPSGLSGL